MKIGKSYFEDVFLWEEELFGSVRGKPAEVVSPELQQRLNLSKSLIEEEFKELMEAFEAGDYKGMVDGAGDLIWVTCGLIAKAGIDLDAAWEEIRRSNWAKKGGPRRESDGKLLKPEDWTPPDFTPALVGRDLLRLVGRRQELECEVCGRPAIGVCSSPLGPVSHAFCRECLRADRQPWHTLIGGLAGCDKHTVADWVWPYIKATCAHYNKTEDELWEEVKGLDKKLEELDKDQCG